MAIWIKSGLPLRKIGSREFIEELLSDIAFRKNIGDILAEGAPRAADMLPDAWPLYEKYYPAHGQTEHNSVREFPAIALLWALDSRDPMIDHHAYRHLSVSRQRWPQPHQLPLEKARAISEKIFGSKTAIDHETYAHKSKVVAYCQNRSAVIDSLVLCEKPEKSEEPVPEKKPIGRELDPQVAPLVEDARKDLIKRFNLAAEQIMLQSVEAVQWRNSSLGCPKPGMNYLMVITPGYLLRFEVGGKTYEYHTSDRHVVYCDDPQPPLDSGSGSD